MDAKAKEMKEPHTTATTSTPAGTVTRPMGKGAASAAQPSGPRGDSPSIAGPGATAGSLKTPENRSGSLNPSAPEDSNTTPGTTGEK